eukprot:2558984-Rhodomonas_salina.1
MAAASSLEGAVASAETVGTIVSYVGAKRFLGEVYPTQYTFQWAGFRFAPQRGGTARGTGI